MGSTALLFYILTAILVHKNNNCLLNKYNCNTYKKIPLGFKNAILENGS